MNQGGSILHCSWDVNSRSEEDWDKMKSDWTRQAEVWFTVHRESILGLKKTGTRQCWMNQAGRSLIHRSWFVSSRFEEDWDKMKLNEPGRKKIGKSSCRQAKLHSAYSDMKEGTFGLNRNYSWNKNAKCDAQWMRIWQACSLHRRCTREDKNTFDSSTFLSTRDLHFCVHRDRECREVSISTAWIRYNSFDYSLPQDLRKNKLIRWSLLTMDCPTRSTQPGMCMEHVPPQLARSGKLQHSNSSKCSQRRKEFNTKKEKIQRQTRKLRISTGERKVRLEVMNFFKKINNKLANWEFQWKREKSAAGGHETFFYQNWNTQIAMVIT